MQDDKQLSPNALRMWFNFFGVPSLVFLMTLVFSILVFPTRGRMQRFKTKIAIKYIFLGLNHILEDFLNVKDILIWLSKLVSKQDT